MPGTLVIGAEDVILVDRDPNYAANRPIPEGLEFVMQLKPFPTSRLVVVCSTTNTEGAVYWTKMNGLNGASVIVKKPEDHQLEPWEAQWNSIQRVRAGGPLRYVVTAHPEVWMRCAETHQPVLLFARYGVVGSPLVQPSWDTLTQQVRLRKEAEAKLLEVEDGNDY